MPEPVSYGGQAVIEGVMMRGPRFFAVACRRSDGSIQVELEAVPAFFTRYQWAKWPFMRGVFALADSLILGMKSLLFSANLAMADTQAPAGPATDPAAGEAPAAEKAPPVDPVTQVLLAPLHLLLGAGAASPPAGPVASVAVTSSAILGWLISVGLFMLLPTVIAGWFTPIVGKTTWLSVIEGVIRVALVIGYIAGIGRMAQVQRLFQYHGAEHQAINALETEGVVDVDAAMRASRIHPRCGTNFVLTVLLVKMLVFTAIPFGDSVLARVLLRLGLLPVVASVSYEVIRLAGKFRDFAPLQWLVTPGLLTQRLTTREPEREMVEVAVASLRGVMEREGHLPPPADPEPAEIV